MAKSIQRSELEYLKQRATHCRDLILSHALHPNQRKSPVEFSASRLSGILGRSPVSVGKVLKEHLMPPDNRTKDASRYVLSQDHVRQLLKHYKLAPPGNRLGKVVVVLNQKGGVGKTTTVAHAAAYAALQGYRVAVLDLDSQASYTSFQGVNPDIDVTEDDTFAPVLTGEDRNPNSDHSPGLLSRLRQADHLENLSFLPSCLELANGDMLSMQRAIKEKYGIKSEDDTAPSPSDEPYVIFGRLRSSIEPLREKFDLIFVDGPPHLSSISWNCVYAADMLLIPLSAHMLDLASTIRFIEWLTEISDSLQGLFLQKLRFLVTNYDDSPASRADLQIVKQTLGEHLLKERAIHSSEIQRAGTILKTIYEVPHPIGSRSAWSRACKGMDAVNRLLVQEIEELWSDEAPTPTTSPSPSALIEENANG